jgi:cell division transport system permease protein
MEIRHHRHQKKKLGSFPYFSVVFSITLALFVIGLFGLLVLHTTRLTGTIRENISMQVYLDKFITENDKIKLNRILSSRPFVARSDGDPQITFISREEAARIFIQDTEEDFEEFLGDNPLRDAFNIKIAAAYQHVDSLRQIKTNVSRMDGVFEVVYMENLVRTINENLAKVAVILLSLATILLVTIIVLINNTIKLALFSQRFLIRSMQLIGAKAGFIITPFVNRSALHGLLAGIIASGMLYGLLRYANTRIEELESLQNDRELLLLFGGLVVLGILIATTSTYNSVKKYLKMSLDELY